MADDSASFAGRPLIVEYARDNVDPFRPYTRPNAHLLQELADAWVRQSRPMPWSEWAVTLMAFAVNADWIGWGWAAVAAAEFCAIVSLRRYRPGSRSGAIFDALAHPATMFCCLIYAIGYSGFGFQITPTVIFAAIAATLGLVGFGWYRYGQVDRIIRLETTHVQPEIADRFRHLARELQGNRVPGTMHYYHGFFTSIIRIAPIGELLVMTHGKPNELQFAAPDDVRLESPVQAGPGQMVHAWLKWKGKRHRVRGSEKDVETLGRILRQTDNLTM